MQADKPKRTIKSFMLRAGRGSRENKSAIYEELWPKYGIEVTKGINSLELFGNSNKLVLEIGFGTGDSLLSQALANPSFNFIGIEVFEDGVIKLLQKIKDNSIINPINNLKIIRHDAVEVLRNYVFDQSLDKVQIFFPDPWPKLKHHKRRLVNSIFIELVSSKIKTEGILHMATDWEHYAKQMLKVTENSNLFINKYGKNNFATDQYGRFNTKFEVRGKNLGHGVWDLVFEKLDLTY